jgi:hypothetical protein
MKQSKALESFMGWIDLEPKDLSRARDYLGKLEEGTLDELGFGIIRDSFSEDFFPATSTVMTIARQYLFVPFCCIHIESRMAKEKNWNTRNAMSELYNMENHLRHCVSPIIKEKVKRLPSIIYWPALRKLKIFKGGHSISSYFRKVKEVADRSFRDDDGMAHLAREGAGFWDPEVVKLYFKEKNFIEDNRFQFDDPEDIKTNGELTLSEARYLQAVYRRHQKTEKSSIMSYLLDREMDIEFFFPWDSPCPSELKAKVEESHKFSMLVAGARLVYYQMILDERHARGLPDIEAPDYSELFSAWWNRAHEELSTWDVRQFFEMKREALRSYRKDTEFISGFCSGVQRHHRSRVFFNASEICSLITERERIVRPQKSRLRNPKYLEQWEPHDIDILAPGFAFGLDYRAGIASKLTREIILGLRKEKN